MVHETDLQALRCEERLEFWEAEATDGPVPASVVDWETEIGGWTLEGDAQAARAAVFRTMLVSPSLDVEGLFELLQAPERLTAAAVSERAQSLDALLEYL